MKEKMNEDYVQAQMEKAMEIMAEGKVYGESGDLQSALRCWRKGLNMLKECKAIAIRLEQECNGV